MKGSLLEVGRFLYFNFRFLELTLIVIALLRTNKSVQLYKQPLDSKSILVSWWTLHYQTPATSKMSSWWWPQLWWLAYWTSGNIFGSDWWQGYCKWLGQNKVAYKSVRCINLSIYCELTRHWSMKSTRIFEMIYTI